MSQLWVRLSQIEVEKLKAVEEAVHCRCTALHCGAGGEEEGRREERMTVEEERMSVEEERMTVEGERDEVARLGEEAAREMEGAKNLMWTARDSQDRQAELNRLQVSNCGLKTFLVPVFLISLISLSGCPDIVRSWEGHRRSECQGLCPWAQVFSSCLLFPAQ